MTYTAIIVCISKVEIQFNLTWMYHTKLYAGIDPHAIDNYLEIINKT